LLIVVVVVQPLFGNTIFDLILFFLSTYDLFLVEECKNFYTDLFVRFPYIIMLILLLCELNLTICFDFYVFNTNFNFHVVSYDPNIVQIVTKNKLILIIINEII